MWLRGFASACNVGTQAPGSGRSPGEAPLLMEKSEEPGGQSREPNLGCKLSDFTSLTLNLEL